MSNCRCDSQRATWSSDHLKNAMKAVERGLSQRQAAHRYGIARRTLRNHITSGSVERQLGRYAVISPVDENELKARIKRYASVGFPLTKKCIQVYAHEFVTQNGIPHPFLNGKAGRRWFESFLKRHPDLSIRKAQSMNPGRAAKLNRFIVNDYFMKLEAILQENNLLDQPSRIYNMDEKGCRLMLHHKQKVIGEVGQKRLHLVAPEHGENVTIVGCANAIGNCIPPMILFKGVRRKESYGDNLPPQSIFEMSAKGSMTYQLFIKWIWHFAKHKPQGPVLLIVDGAKCHLHPGIIDAATPNEIILFCLPSNTTHELQPLDKSVFRSFEHYWDGEVLHFWKNKPNRSLTKDVFGRLFTPVWSKAMSISNITQGFQATGIYPLNPRVIPNEAFTPSELSTIEETTLSNNHLLPVVPDHQSVCSPGPCQSSIDSSSSRTSPSTNQTISADFFPSDTNVSFSKLMSTPKLKRKVVNRKKSLNYKATPISKELFGLDSTAGHSSNGNASGVGNKRQKKQKMVASWYCHICGEDEKRDMRKCSCCSKWYHEDCVGLTEDDTSVFKCFDC